MAKKITIPSFNDALAALAGHQFDVAEARNGANGASHSRSEASSIPTRPLKRTDGAPGNSGLIKSGVKAYQVRKYGCAAEIAAAADGTVMVLRRPGWLLGGEIARLVDKGYQKFLKTPRLEIPATADHLHAIHEFTEELKEAAGATSLYNESLGTTSDKYVYDRVKGRE
ncbi:MAG TPA: hypothetical protein VN612_03620 [Acidobacteriaceae bacterium]|nr:hypothetical protein [Acidobacteriaceae bacterium]